VFAEEASPTTATVGCMSARAAGLTVHRGDAMGAVGMLITGTEAMGAEGMLITGTEAMGAEGMIDHGTEAMGAEGMIDHGSDAMGAVGMPMTGTEAMGAEGMIDHGRDAMGAVGMLMTGTVAMVAEGMIDHGRDAMGAVGTSITGRVAVGAMGCTSATAELAVSVASVAVCSKARTAGPRRATSRALFFSPRRLSLKIQCNPERLQCLQLPSSFPATHLILEARQLLQLLLFLTFVIALHSSEG